ncbi:MAG: DUF1850 domain-containing protein [Syntrophobacterales bacterium]|nr:DUF1850 domain-containing protein [Syntrophobacterales bacterium]
MASLTNRAPLLRRPVLVVKNGILTLFVIAMLVAAGFYPLHFLQIENQRTGKALLVRRVLAKDKFSLRYKHSVELCSIWDGYLVDDRYRLVLDETVFGSSNTGLPAILGEGEILSRAGNNYRIANMRRVLPHVDFWVNKKYENTLEFAGDNINLPSLAGDSLLRLSIQKASLFEFACKKVLVFTPL